MNYKIVSQNKNLIEKSSTIFNILGMKESIHIQDVNFWLVDVKTIDNTSLLSYKNRIQYSNILFIVNDEEDIKLCLKNEFTNYIKIDFSSEELKTWCKYFISKNQKSIFYINENYQIDFENSYVKKDEEEILLSKQECELLKQLQNSEFVTTKNLANLLNLNSTTSVRTIITRIRKKLGSDIFIQKRDYGYKLNIKEEKTSSENFDSYVKELEEQNLLMQEIVDSSPSFIVTFIHKQLYCINKSFRDFLGNEIIKELWDEEKGDFFLLIKHNKKEYELLKKELFTIGKHEVDLYDFNKNSTNKFEVQTFYFGNLDKHLLIFETTK